MIFSLSFSALIISHQLSKDKYQQIFPDIWDHITQVHHQNPNQTLLQAIQSQKKKKKKKSKQQNSLYKTLINYRVTKRNKNQHYHAENEKQRAQRNT